MAISTGFKTQCPSCGATLPIKDVSLIGKKISCSRCKYTFVVEAPPKEDKEELIQKDKESVKKGKTSEAITAKGAKGKADPDADEAVTEKPRANGKAAKAKTKPDGKRLRDEDDGEEETPKKGKAKKGKGGSNNKLVLGLALAGVGVAVLGVAAYFIFSNGSSTPAKKSDTPVASGPRPKTGGPGDNAGGPGDGDGAAEPKKEGPGKAPAEKNALPGAVAGAPLPYTELTNLLPPTAEHVVALHAKDILEGIAGDAATAPRALDEDLMRSRLGFTVHQLEEVIRGESYSGRWAFNVLSSSQGFDMGALAEAMQLKPAPGDPIKGQEYFITTGANLWMNHFGRLTPGNKAGRNFADADRPLAVRLHNATTLVIADVAPMQEFLTAEGRFPFQAEKKAAPPPKKKADGGGNRGGGGRAGRGGRPNPGGMPNPGGPGGPGAGPGPGPGPGGRMSGFPGGGSPGPAGGFPGQGGGGNAEPAPAAPTVGRPDTYMTISASLKAMLDLVEEVPENSKLKVLLASATDLNAARAEGRPGAALGLAFQFRQSWDVTRMLEDKARGINVVGTALLQRDAGRKKYTYLNALDCEKSADAKSIEKELKERVGADVARFLELLLGQKVEVPVVKTKKDDEAADTGTPGFPGVGGRLGPGPGPGGPGGMIGPGRRPPPSPGAGGGPGGMAGRFGGVQTQEPEEKPADEAKHTRIRVEHNDTLVTFSLDLVLDNMAFNRLVRCTELLLMNLNAEMETATGTERRHTLAQAGKLLGERGLSDKQIPAGHFPPGAFSRGGVKTRAGQEPGNRISWMAGLLPMLGRQSLYQKINFNARWDDPTNWLAARTLVPEFIDPAYPLGSRFARTPQVPVDVAATHFVGLAGIGVDAADAEFRADPANVAKLGVFGYDQPTPLKALERGLSNTALMIQIPHDGPAPPGSWLAGGGSTVRGVPEKGSIKPFVATQFNGQRGTMMLMADGSVRFVSDKISDTAFQALVRIKGGTPEGFELDLEAPKVPAAKKENGQAPPAPAPVEASAPPAEAPLAEAPPPVAQAAPPEQEKEQPKAALPKGWKAFSPAGELFTVAAPGKLDKKEMPGPAGSKVRVYMLLKADVGQSYAAIVTDIPPEEAKLSQEKMFANFRAGAIKGIEQQGLKGVKVKSERSVTQGDHPGREYVLDIPGTPAPIYSVIRGYIANDRLYSLTFTAPAQGGNAPAEAASFFNSFRILAK